MPHPSHLSYAGILSRFFPTPSRYFHGRRPRRCYRASSKLVLHFRPPERFLAPLFLRRRFSLRAGCPQAKTPATVTQPGFARLPDGMRALGGRGDARHPAAASAPWPGFLYLRIGAMLPASTSRLSLRRSAAVLGGAFLLWPPIKQEPRHVKEPGPLPTGWVRGSGAGDTPPGGTESTP